MTKLINESLYLMMWCLGTGPSPWNAKLQVLCHYSVLPEIPVCINIHIHTSAWMHVYLKTDLLTIYWASILCKCSAPSISTNPAGMSLVHGCCLINTVPWFLHLHFTLLWARGSPWGGGRHQCLVTLAFLHVMPPSKLGTESGRHIASFLILRLLLVRAWFAFC